MLAGSPLDELSTTPVENALGSEILQRSPI